LSGLFAAKIIERNIPQALQLAFRVPLGLAVANVIDHGHWIEP
jgi:hypothetical protein